MGDLQKEMKIRQRVQGMYGIACATAFCEQNLPHNGASACAGRCSFNRQANDFPGLQEWNNYLEEREDISKQYFLASAVRHIHDHGSLGDTTGLHAVMNLAEGIDVSATESKVAAYQQENYQEILENQTRQVNQIFCHAISFYSFMY